MSIDDRRIHSIAEHTRAVAETLAAIWEDLEQKALFIRVGDRGFRQGEVTSFYMDSAFGRIVLYMNNPITEASFMNFEGEEAEALKWYFTEVSLDIVAAYREAKKEEGKE